MTEFWSRVCECERNLNRSTPFSWNRYNNFFGEIKSCRNSFNVDWCFFHGRLTYITTMNYVSAISAFAGVNNVIIDKVVVSKCSWQKRWAWDALALKQQQKNLKWRRSARCGSTDNRIEKNSLFDNAPKTSPWLRPWRSSRKNWCYFYNYTIPHLIIII